jgi:hypothetical protein
MNKNKARTISSIVIVQVVALLALANFGCAPSVKPGTARVATSPAPPSPAEPRPAPAAPAAVPAPSTESRPATADQLKLKVVRVDSEETSAEDGKGANAVDGDASTFWHTQWQDENPPPPHEIIIELSQPAELVGFSYLPRQDDSDHGTIKDYEFYVSQDGKDFGQPVKTGTFENDKEKKKVVFAPTKCRFIKLRALTEVNGEAWTSAAEIGVIQAE